MGRPFIVLGDKTDHGGTVITGAPTSVTGSKPIARIGDTVTCPRPDCVVRGMGTNQIVSGDQTIIVDGQPVARHGDKTACGATLISSQMPTTAGGPGGKTAAAQSTEPVPADLALQSDADSFDDLPPKAKAYVYNQAADAGVFAGDEALETAGTGDVDHETYDNGMEHFTAYDPKVAARIARAQMGLRPYEALSPDQIMDADPDNPKTSPGGTGVHYKHLAQVDLHGGSWLARFADSRPTEGIANLSDAPNATPDMSATGRAANAKTTAVGAGFGALEKGMKASKQGLKQRINIYEAPGGKKMVEIKEAFPNQRTGAMNTRPFTETQVLSTMNHPAVEGLDDTMQQTEKEQLDAFYRQTYGR